MKPASRFHRPPPDADARRAVAPVICYPTDTLPRPDLGLYRAARAEAGKTGEILIPPREARCFEVPAGHFLRISAPRGPQVGDLVLGLAQGFVHRFR